MPSLFADLGVPADVVNLLAERGVDAPFPIQEATIPAALAGRDVCGKAPTGSGKTLAFGLPVIERTTRARVARPRTLILAPTRELAQQIHDSLAPLAKVRGRSVATFYGGVSFTPQLKVLRRGVDIAVGCPGRIADLVNRTAMVLDEVELVVLDEADRMADMGFLPEVKRLLDRVRPDRQTLLFSATLDGAVDVLVKRYQNKPVFAEAAGAGDDDVANLAHHFVPAKRDQRVRLTAELISEHGRTIVFSRTKHGADRIARQLTTAGVNAVAIHGGRTQAQRDRALAAFSSGKADALVATDVAARGIHVDGVACVVHFDVPTDVKDYVHRSGRTGRAGADGKVFSLVTDEDHDKVKAIRKVVGGAHPEPARPEQARPRLEPSRGRRTDSRPRPESSGRPARKSRSGRIRGPRG